MIFSSLGWGLPCTADPSGHPDLARPSLSLGSCQSLGGAGQVCHDWHVVKLGPVTAPSLARVKQGCGSHGPGYIAKPRGSWFSSGIRVPAFTCLECSKGLAWKVCPREPALIYVPCESCRVLVPCHVALQTSVNDLGTLSQLFQCTQARAGGWVTAQPTQLSSREA